MIDWCYTGLDSCTMLDLDTNRPDELKRAGMIVLSKFSFAKNGLDNLTDEEATFVQNVLYGKCTHWSAKVNTKTKSVEWIYT